MAFSLNVKKFIVTLGSVWAAAIASGAEPSLFEARVAPIFEEHCVECHGADKHKGKLRLDSYAALMKGAESGDVVAVGDAKSSELFRRITLPETDEDVMPSDRNPALSADEIKVIELWISGGASETKPVKEFAGLPPLKPAKAPYVPLTPDWRPRATEIVAVAKALHIRVVPRSQIATDGLIVRTASAPWRCNDAALAKLSAFAPFIVEMELARTKVTDEGLKSVAAFTNLRAIDLTRTAVSSNGLDALLQLEKLESINLTETAVDESGIDKLKTLPSLRKSWIFNTKAAPGVSLVTAKN